jgi:hypothetical protein
LSCVPGRSGAVWTNREVTPAVAPTSNFNATAAICTSSIGESHGSTGKIGRIEIAMLPLVEYIWFMMHHAGMYCHRGSFFMFFALRRNRRPRFSFTARVANAPRHDRRHGSAFQQSAARPAADGDAHDPTG